MKIEHRTSGVERRVCARVGRNAAACRLAGLVSRMRQGLPAFQARHPLWLGFGVLTLLLLALGAFATLALSSIAGSVRTQHENAWPRAEASRGMAAAALAYALNVRTAGGGAPDPSAVAAAEANAVDFERRMAIYRQLAKSPGERRMADRCSALWREFRTEGQKLLGAKAQRQSDYANLAALRRKLGDVLEEGITHAKAECDAGAEATLSRLSGTTGITAAILCGSAALALMISAAVGRRVLGSEAALRESEERLRLATQAAGMFAWECDLAAGTLYWSENAAAVIGCMADDLPGRPSERLFFAGSAEQPRLRKLHDETVMRAEADYFTDFQGRGNPDTARHFLMHVHVLYGPDGAAQRILGVTQDVTKRRRANAQIWHQMNELAEANRELARYSEAFAGRDDRILALQREVNELCAECGQARRYPLAGQGEKPPSPAAIGLASDADRKASLDEAEVEREADGPAELAGGSLLAPRPAPPAYRLRRFP